jgi:hypothetical protein
MPFTMLRCQEEKMGKGIAVVTGASSGLGKVYADRLAKRGYDVLLVARRKERLESLSTEIEGKYGVRSEFLVADLGNEADLKRVYERLASDEKITMLVNNAGTALNGPAFQLPLEAIDGFINVNTRAVTWLSRAVLPRFMKNNEGTLINIGSVFAFFNVPGATPYAGSKADVMMFTMGVQAESAGTKVRIQLVLPAGVGTEIWDVAGIGVDALDPATVMTTENCVDAALAGLDMGELVTLPSVEDPTLWMAFDEARTRMFLASNTGKPASRYGLKKTVEV